MEMQQKVFVLKTTLKKTEGLDELNTHLSRGWRVVDISPMGGAAVGSSTEEPWLHLGAVVVVEREVSSRASVLEEAEEEMEERIEEIVEGNGKELEMDNGSEESA